MDQVYTQKRKPFEKWDYNSIKLLIKKKCHAIFQISQKPFFFFKVNKKFSYCWFEVIVGYNCGYWSCCGATGG